MAKGTFDFTTEPGAIIITDDAGNKSSWPLADMLRAADIPIGLTYTQVAAISALANLVVILIRTLIERQILDESFADSLGLDLDLEHVVAAIEAMGGSYHEPGLEDADA